MLLEIDETMNPIFFCEAGHELHAMLVNPFDQVARYADIERTAYFAGEDVNPICSFPAHAATRV
jgi:hypothetical protein